MRQLQTVAAQLLMTGPRTRPIKLRFIVRERLDERAFMVPRLGQRLRPTFRLGGKDRWPGRFSMRLPEQDLAIIDRAAGLRGHSRTDFVREAAVRAAEEVLLEQSVVRLGPVEFEAFKAAVEAPPQVVPEMTELLKRRAPWER